MIPEAVSRLGNRGLNDTALPHLKQLTNVGVLFLAVVA